MSDAKVSVESVVWHKNRIFSKEQQMPSANKSSYLRNWQLFHRIYTEKSVAIGKVIQGPTTHWNTSIYPEWSWLCIRFFLFIYLDESMTVKKITHVHCSKWVICRLQCKQSTNFTHVFRAFFVQFLLFFSAFIRRVNCSSNKIVGRYFYDFVSFGGGVAMYFAALSLIKPMTIF